MESKPTTHGQIHHQFLQESSKLRKTKQNETIVGFDLSCSHFAQ